MFDHHAADVPLARISSRATFFAKRVFPIIWFGLVILFGGVVLVNAARGRTDDTLLLLVFMPVMLVMGWFVMRRLVFLLADEVWDAGDTLIVRKGGREVRIPLCDIVNVNYSHASNPAHITLQLRNESQLGAEICFLPPGGRLNPYAPPPLAKQLIARIDAARRQRPTGQQGKYLIRARLLQRSCRKSQRTFSFVFLRLATAASDARVSFVKDLTRCAAAHYVGSVVGFTLMETLMHQMRRI